MGRTFYSKEIVEKDGLYIFACRYDNHLDYEAYFLNKGEKYWKYFIDEFSHSDGWMTIDPLAVHYIPPYDKDNNTGWANISQGCYDRRTNLCIVAYTLDNQIKYAFYHSDLDPIEDDEFNKKYKDINERISYLSSIRHKISLEGMYLFHKYNEGDHIRHWNQVFQEPKIPFLKRIFRRVGRGK